MPTMNPVTMSAQVIYFIPKAFINDWVILCAAPLSATSFPSIAPSEIIMINEPNVEPIPFSTDLVILSNGIPSSKPARIDTIKKARKGLNFAQVISNTSRRMLNKTISKVIIWQGWLNKARPL